MATMPYVNTIGSTNALI